jgi:alpha-1,2-rhamnosyltransferase
LPEPLWTYNIWNLRFIKKYKNLGNAFIPLIYDISFITNPEYYDKYVYKLFNRNFNSIIPNSIGIITISRSEKRIIEEYLNQKKVKKTVEYFYLGFNINTKTKSYEKFDIKSENYFLMVGTLDPHKNHDFVIKAFEILWNNGFKDDLILVGAPGWNSKTLNRINYSPFLNKKLFYFGYVTDSKLNYLYKNAKALIFASNREGFGLPLVEAISQGINVIASDIDVFKEVGKDCVIYFKQNNIEDFMKKIKTFQKKEELHCQNLTILNWEQSINMFCQSIKNLIEKYD